MRVASIHHTEFESSLCPCGSTWVLVVHNNFKGVPNYERRGNEADVKNLRKVFSQDRNCRFAELENHGSSEIVQTLSRWDKLLELFTHLDESHLRPLIFCVIILSHGDSGGIILTDHTLVDAETEDNKFDSYLTSDVWNALASIDMLRDCPKILFFAPCRGSENEVKLQSTSILQNTKIKGWLSTQPNKINFIIFYATVESTTTIRDEKEGTWLAQVICKELNNLQEDEDLLIFLTKVQSGICNKFKLNGSSQGQTPQLHAFATKSIIVCRKHSGGMGPAEPVQDCEIRQADKRASLVTTDAIAHVECLRSGLFFSWKTSQGRPLFRGMALIFYDQSHEIVSAEIGASFQHLGYDIKLYDINKNDPVKVMKNISWRLKYDASLVLCTLVRLEETPVGLTLECNNKSIPLAGIVNTFCSSKCMELLGKPKLCFFLDERMTSDGLMHIKPADESQLQFSNVHAGVCCFIGVGTKGPSGCSIVETVAQTLCALYKNPGQSLQSALTELIRMSATYDQCIKPQIITTLPLLIDFPELEIAYRDKLKRNPQFYRAGILGLIVLGLLLGIAICIGMSSSISPGFEGYLYIDESCQIKEYFTTLNQSQDYELSEEMWNETKLKCENVWKGLYKLEYSLMNFNANGSLNLSAEFVNSLSNDEPAILRLGFLLGHNNKALIPNFVRTVSSLTNTKLKITIYRTLFLKMHYQLTNFLDYFLLSYYLSLESISEFITLNSEVNIEKSSIIKNNCSGILKLRAYLRNWHTKELKFVMNDLVSNCEPYDVHWEEIFQLLLDFPHAACHSSIVLMQKMESLRTLGSLNAATLRGLIRFLSTSNELSDKDISECNYVATKIKQHEEEQQLQYLKLFDGNYYLSLYERKSLEFIFPDIVKKQQNNSYTAENKLIDLFWTFDQEMQDTKCLGTQALLHQMNSSGRLSSLQMVTLLSYVRNYLLTVDSPSSGCLDAVTLAANWIKRFLFELKTEICDSLCIEDAANGVKYLVEDCVAQNDCQRKEILLADYVIEQIKSNLTSTQQTIITKVSKLKSQLLDVLADLISTNQCEYLIHCVEIKRINDEVQFFFLPQLVNAIHIKKRQGFGTVSFLWSLLNNVSVSCVGLNELVARLEHDQATLEGLVAWFMIDLARTTYGAVECVHAAQRLSTLNVSYADLWNENATRHTLLIWIASHSRASRLFPAMARVLPHTAYSDIHQLVEFFKNVALKGKDKRIVCPGLRQIVAQLDIKRSEAINIFEKIIEPVARDALSQGYINKTSGPRRGTQLYKYWHDPHISNVDACNQTVHLMSEYIASRKD